jgi:very-short-patch-repair endonuclease
MYRILKSLSESFKFELSTDTHFRFDFCIEELKIIIELDRIHHFEIVKHWKNNPEEQLERDKFKMKCANDNGYSIIRILQEDI